MRRLIENLSASLDPVSLVRRAAEQMCLYTPAASGASIVLRDPECSDNLVFVAAHGSTASLLGYKLPRAGSFVELAMQSREPLIVDDITADPRVQSSSRAIAAGLGVRSWIVIPLRHHDLVVGAMSVVAPTPSAFDDSAAAAIVSLSSFVAALMSSQKQLTDLFATLHPEAVKLGVPSEPAKFVASLLYPESIEADATHGELDRLFAPGALQPVFQPIVDLSTGHTVGYEGLSRFPHAPERNVEEWFGVAQRAGRGADLEIHAVDEILSASAQLTVDLPVAVNLSPCAAADPRARALLLAARRPVCVELTEHDRFPDDLFDALTPLRHHGLDIAVDDVGAGYATLLQILRLKPDVIKIDAEFTAGVQSDPARRVLTAAIVELSDEVGAVTVAEAIETEDQLRALRELGVSRGQGYYLGRPRPASRPHSLAPA
ncbi:MAG: EAL domain-containing protein [Mycobacterium kyogaense]|uniref:sensor domain-containing phosphodiesterase n=1 Tax=Mycobacterium kyogaense TaxID=2212479 RepID=UPI002FF9F18C